MLSALVDGEADASQAVALRAHLRQCLACRATMRGLHDASQPLTVVFPATALVAANGGVEQTGSFFVRVYETVSLHLHERAANSVLRAQAVFDTVTAGKMAAAAASAAAVAGGGFAVEGVVSSPRGDRPTAILRGAASSAARPALKTKTVPRAGRQGSAKRPASGKQHGSAKSRAPSHRRARTRSRQASTASTATQSAATGTTASAQPRPAAAQPGAVAASAGASQHAAGAAGEFGFEGP
jgi:hypothetical protein